MNARIALTGGIACGKSLFAKFLVELGIRLLDADDVVHDLEKSGGEAVAEIVREFSSEVLASDGGIDRVQLAKIVFGDAEARKKLEGILFPRVRARLNAFTCGGKGEIRIAVIPLLFESHWETDYDIILCIASPESLQIDRMMSTRGYSRDEALARLTAQIPVQEKMARSDLSVINDSTAGKLKQEAERVLAWLQKRLNDEH